MTISRRWLRNLTDIRNLELKMPKLKDISVLENMPYLSEVDLSGTSIDTVRPIRNITNIVNLNFANTKIDSVYFLKRMTFLETLDVSGNEIDDLENLTNCTGLTYLDVADTGITRSVYEQLVEALPNAEIVYKHDQVTGGEVQDSDDENEDTDSEIEYDGDGNPIEREKSSSADEEDHHRERDDRNGSPSTNGYWFENDYTGGYSFYCYDDGNIYNDGENGYHYNGEPV